MLAIASHVSNNYIFSHGYPMANVSQVVYGLVRPAFPEPTERD